MNAISQFFPEFSPRQRAQLQAFEILLRDYNRKVNLISRQREDRIEMDHFLPSLAIAKILRPAPKSRWMDVGTGGGLPGIPLAIAFPECEFLLVDSIRKKIDAVEFFAPQLQLANVRSHCCRAESVPERFDFITGRAVVALPDFLRWTFSKLRPGRKSSLANGILYLKGGNASQEIAPLEANSATIFPLADIFDGEIAADKFIIHIPFESK